MSIESLANTLLLERYKKENRDRDMNIKYIVYTEYVIFAIVNSNSISPLYLSFLYIQFGE